MMRGETVMATAVRDPGGEIQIESQRFVPLKEKSVFFKIPVVRGALALFANIGLGMKTLTRASTVYGEIDDKKSSGIIMVLGVVLGIALALGLFIFIPDLAATGLGRLFKIENIANTFARSLVDRLMAGIKDIKRLFRYHGAEHKTINCFEHGLPITVENVQKSSRIHDRCGTTFMFLVMVVAIIAFAFTGFIEQWWLRVLVRLAGIPVVAGISYEILMLLAKFDNVFVKILKAPGLLLQKISTAEPDDKMVEVAIKAFSTVLEMQQDLNLPETKFEIVSRKPEATGDNQSPNTGHQPPQYKESKAHFYGYEFVVNQNVLIPRFDTEHLAEQAIIKAKTYENPKVLEICTGSGAVAVAVKKQVPNASVVMTDISSDALIVARLNAVKNGAQIDYIESDLFQNVVGEFDIIIANPPYIPTGDIQTLDPMVKNYEPGIALDGGSDGLDFYRRIADSYKKYLNEGGYLMLEVGINQAVAVQEIFKKEAEIIKDYNDPPIERVLIFNKPAGQGAI
jgi:release factor-specific protein-(glutamine-N5) methyltransferase